MPKSKKELIVVGIGASAGGLEALQGFVKNLPTKTNTAYILAQHLSPTYKSMMVDLLAKDTTISIKEGKNQQKIEPDTMYICPPNKNIIIEDDQILIIDPKQLTYGPKPSINILFESIAANKGNKAIGIILSGTGSDGSRGLRAIKAEGGFTIVQQPQSAKYDGMPNSAINTGNVDLILDVEIMGKEIVELLKYPDRTESLSNMNDKTVLYKNILAKLKRSKKIDFSLYKSTTIQRRIERRMVALKLTNLKDYNEYLLKSDNNEVEELFKDILIGVTSFFRDEEAFLVLKNYLKNYLEKKEDTNIRIWVPGCSTGEEPYSIAMVLSELLGNEIVKYKIQIFATDIDEEATKFARAGKYPESTLINVEKNYIKKYFTLKNDEYEIIKPIRDMCIFSRHDITNDPAFMRLDLISCRNLLIYFTSELQQKLFPMFHYSLNDDALLFLGKSESIGNFNHQFKIVDKKYKIYRAMYLGQKTAPFPLRTFESKSIKDYEYIENKKSNNGHSPTISEMMTDHIERHILPMCVVVNDSFDMIYIKGDNPYLKRPMGEISQNIFKNVRNELSVELRANFHISKKEGRLVKTSYQKISIDKKIKFVRMLVSPLDNSLTNDLYLVCFQEEEEENFNSFQTTQSNVESGEEVTRLNLELSKTKEHLQTVIEELETSNEEMQSLNEELQSSNEELQSSNEELETTNEELQSTNEELQTAYSEMRAMYEERDKDAKQITQIKENLENVNYRLTTVLKSSNVGVFDIDLMSNETLFINEQWAEIFGYSLKELEDEKNLALWFASKIHKDDFKVREEQFEKLLLGKINNYNLELRVQHKNGHYIWVKCFTVSIIDDVSKKAVRAMGTLQNIDKVRKDQLEKEMLQTKLNDAIDMANLGVWEWNIEEDTVWWSDLMYEIYEISLDTKLDLKVIQDSVVDKDKEKHTKDVQNALDNLVEHNLIFQINTNSGTKTVWAKGNVIVDENKKPIKMTGLLQDITESYFKDLQLKSKEDYINSILNASFNGVYVFDFVKNNNTYINPQYTKITGYTLNDLNNLKEDQFLNLFHSDDLDMIFKHMEKVKNSINNDSFEIEYRFKHKDGHFVKLISRDCIIVRDYNGEALEMLGTFKEI